MQNLRKKIKYALENIGSATTSTFGLTIILFAIILAVLLTNRFSKLINVLAVFIAGIGTFSGTLIFMKGIYGYKNIELEEKIEKDIVQKEKLKNYDSLQEELFFVKKEKERLENMKIQAEELTAILKLSLLEFNLNVYDYKDELIEKRPNKIPLIENLQEKETGFHYIGLLYQNLKVRFGIDLQNVRVCEMHDTIVVSGIEPEYQGMFEHKNEWKINEIRRRVMKNGKKYSDIYIPNDERLIEQMLKQEEELNRRISRGFDIHANEKMLITLGQEFIKLILKPLNKKIDFSKDIANDASVPLADFICEKNKLLDAEIQKLENL